VTAADSLAAQLEDIAAAIEQARAFEHEHGLSSSRTRKLPADTLRSLRRWRTAVTGDTVTCVVAEGTAATRAASADKKQVNVVCTEEPPTVPAAPSTTIRIPEPLRERVEEYGREHRWSLGETTRVALERLVGYDREPNETERAA
jgi:hypothetical protein